MPHLHLVYLRGQVFSQVFSTYELRPKDFTISHLEEWFTSNIWSVIIDACFIDLKTIEFIRGKGNSCALRLRKNCEKTC